MAAIAPLVSPKDQVVADSLEHLADQIRQAASELRGPNSEPVGARPSQLARCDPRSVVDLIMHELSKRGIKSDFGPDADFAGAERSAAHLLAALGVAVPDDPQAPPREV